jgi:hypothetical protein
VTDTQEARDDTRVIYPRYEHRCKCGHWQDDHWESAVPPYGHCSKCADLADNDIRLDLEPEHKFEWTGDRYNDEMVIPWHVSVYEIDRGYGGPEEGGWWYDCGTCVVTIPVFDFTDAEVDALIETLKKAYPNESRYGVGSVCYEGGEFRVWAERQRGMDYPEERPRYE